jgi:hypothetical protein
MPPRHPAECYGRYLYDTDECNSATPLNATGLFYMTPMNATVPPRWMLRDFFIWHRWMQQCHPAECYGTFLWLPLLMLELSSDTVDWRYPTIDDACHSCLYSINDDIFENGFLCVARMWFVAVGRGLLRETCGIVSSEFIMYLLRLLVPWYEYY